MDLLRIAIILCNCLVLASASARFTNLRCNSLDPEFSTMSQCSLRMMRRNVVGLNITCNLHKLPINNVSINLALFKKSNGYVPFMINMTTDFCKFLKNRAKQPFFKILADFLLRNSNVNHTCPYDHDIIVENLVLDSGLFKFLPLRNGDHMFRLMVAVYNAWKMEFKVFFATNESKSV